MSISEIEFGLDTNKHFPCLNIDKLAQSIGNFRLGTSAKVVAPGSPGGLLALKSNNGSDFDFVDYPSSPGGRSLSSAVSIHSAVSLVAPTSSYWHIPDNQSYLTAIAVREDNNLCAIGSGSVSNNLFLYEVYPDGVTHHQTVMLPEITRLQWASPKSHLGKMGNILVSGHKNGMAHLTLLPDSTSRTSQSAEILKRYNHGKHLHEATLKSDNAWRPRSLRIRDLELTSSSWQCAATSSLVTLCGEHIFMWEPNRSDVPLVMQQTQSTNTFGLCNSRNSIYALGRKRGVCIRDIRVRDKVNSGLKPPIGNDESVSMVKWNPFDGGNQLAAVHDRTTIKIWDIRNKEPLATFSRHMDNINGLEWSARSELVSASADGTVRVWDIMQDSHSGESLKPLSCSSSTSSHEEDKDTTFNSRWRDYRRRMSMDRELEGRTDDLLQNLAPVSQDRQFSAMTLTGMGPSISALTIDSDGYLGVHELSDSASSPHSSRMSIDFS